MAYSCVRVVFEIGHEASVRSQPTPDGFTHDWHVFVRGTEHAEIHHFVEKVVFHLHETFPRPKRVVKEPPFAVKESGYAGFTLPIDVYFKTSEEPKKLHLNYDLDLQPSGPPISRVLTQEFVFRNPGEDLRRRLIKGGGELRPEERVSSTFADLFGPPIKANAKVSPDPKKPSPSPVPTVKPTSSGGKQQPSSSKPFKQVISHNQRDEVRSKEKSKDRERSKDKSQTSAPRSSQATPQKTSSTTSSKSPSTPPKSTPPLPSKPASSRPKDDAKKLLPEETKSKTDPKLGDISKSEKKKKDKRNKDEKPKKEKHSKHETKISEKERKSDSSKEVKEKELPKKPEKESSKDVVKPREKEKEKLKHGDGDKEKRHKHKKKDKSNKDREKEREKDSDKIEKKVEVRDKDKNGVAPATTECVENVEIRKHTVSPSPERPTSPGPSVASKENSRPPAAKRPLALLEQEVSSSDSNISALSGDEDIDFPPPKAPPVPSPRQPSPTPAPVLQQPLSPPPPEPKPEQSTKVVKSELPSQEKNSLSKSSKSKEKDKTAYRKSKDKSGSSNTKDSSSKERKRKRHNSGDDGTSVVQPPSKTMKVEPEEADLPEKQLTAEYVSQLRDLQHKIMTLEDNAELQRVVQVIAETGQYEITKKTFDFDLCALDRSTVRRLQEFFAPS